MSIAPLSIKILTLLPVITDKVVKWNCNNHPGFILNVDGICIGNPQRTGFGGLLRNNAGLFISGFSGYTADSFDVLLAKLHAIYQGLRMVRALGFSDVMCYSNSLHSINLINGPPLKFHAYTTLIHDIKDLIILSSYSIFHTFREGNHCADFLAKKGAAADDVLMIHTSAPEELLPLIRENACGTFFPRG